MAADVTYPASRFQVRQDGRAVVPTGATLDIESGGVLAIAGVTVTASAAELNKNVQSARLVAAGATLAMVEATHDRKTILLDTAAGSIVTLPASTGGGATYLFQISTTATTNSHVVKVANSSDIIQGLIFGLSDDGGGVLKGWEAGATDDTITLNRTTTGTAKIGHFIEIQDIKANTFVVRGFIAQSGTEATPFSATV